MTSAANSPAANIASAKHSISFGTAAELRSIFSPDELVKVAVCKLLSSSGHLHVICIEKAFQARGEAAQCSADAATLCSENFDRIALGWYRVERIFSGSDFGNPGIV